MGRILIETDENGQIKTEIRNIDTIELFAAIITLIEAIKDKEKFDNLDDVYVECMKMHNDISKSVISFKKGNKSKRDNVIDGVFRK